MCPGKMIKQFLPASLTALPYAQVALHHRALPTVRKFTALSQLQSSLLIKLIRVWYLSIAFSIRHGHARRVTKAQLQKTKNSNKIQKLRRKFTEVAF